VILIVRHDTKMNIAHTALLIAAIGFSGCGGVDLSTPEETQLTLNYHYLWNYSAREPRLQIGRRTSQSGYSIVLSDVVSYGWNDDFIIAEQRKPDDLHASSSTNVFTYAIVVINKDEKSPSDYTSLHSDLTYPEYAAARKSLSIPDDLEFTRSYK
jgi:hypothetical protein